MLAPAVRGTSRGRLAARSVDHGIFGMLPCSRILRFLLGLHLFQDPLSFSMIQLQYSNMPLLLSYVPEYIRTCHLYLTALQIEEVQPE